MEVSTTTLEIPEGGAASYSLRLTQQPSDSSRECCGWWVMLRVDDTDDTDDTISWIPSVGWEFKRQEGATGPTAWRGVSIRAEEDDDTDDEVIVFRHEVWDENSNCPDSLHPDSLPVVRVTIIDNDRPGRQPRLSIADTSVVEGDTAQFNVSLTSESAQPVTVSWATADGTAKGGHGLRGEDGHADDPGGGNGPADLRADRGGRLPRTGGTLPGDPERCVGGHAGRRQRGRRRSRTTTCPSCPSTTRPR